MNTTKCVGAVHSCFFSFSPICPLVAVVPQMEHIFPLSAGRYRAVYVCECVCLCLCDLCVRFLYNVLVCLCQCFYNVVCVYVCKIGEMVRAQSQARLGTKQVPCYVAVVG